VLFAQQLLTSVFDLSLPHPKHPRSFAVYRANELTPNLDVYEVSRMIPLSSLAQSLLYVITNCIDKERYMEVLAPACFLEYLCCEYIQHPEMALKARLYRGIALASVGWVSLALENL
jgi:hypothetical protein